MGRFQCRIKLVKDAQQTYQEVYNFLMSEGFEYKEYQKEMLFQKGHGWAVAPSFIKVNADNQYLYIEAFIKGALLPGVYVMEQDLEGVIGIIPKRNLLERVVTMEKIATNGDLSLVECNSQAHAKMLAEMQMKQGMPVPSAPLPQPQAMPQQPMYQAVPQQPMQPMYQPQPMQPQMPQQMPMYGQPMAQPIPQQMPMYQPQPMPQQMPMYQPQPMPQQMPMYQPQPMPQMPQVQPQAMPQAPVEPEAPQAPVDGQ